MKHKAGILVAVVAVAIAGSLAVPAESKLVQGTIKGMLSDSMCKGVHAGMINMGGYGKDAVSCTKKCLQEGYKLVFVDRKTKTVYALQNPGQAKKFAGKNVVINGHIDAATKVIHVHSVKLG